MAEEPGDDPQLIVNYIYHYIIGVGAYNTQTGLPSPLSVGNGDSDDMSGNVGVIKPDSDLIKVRVEVEGADPRDPDSTRLSCMVAVTRCCRPCRNRMTWTARGSGGRIEASVRFDRTFHDRTFLHCCCTLAHCSIHLGPCSRNDQGRHQSVTRWLFKRQKAIEKLHGRQTSRTRLVRTREN